ncbi:hypothetical protein [Natronobacterium gregoryi]|uniref:Uncharacterized protein n=1 Tax=Natronobacterium gregoryi (strain ATCC 43098 / DSM 3393 / CCM 3738 / CIP 104747 / IAM 13177 / JCM 8860 / NBRC 102187 / NCIMB 2189 / SP2) TaxID=797304 RepID=L0AJF7_NATGS|nr:hypothetical protein [Natronobacterium gregoryi]AFZ73574.1 hypothetical protein Natgr_2403 [Natronobacterium gregoryi SP2]ELY68241.1 hypothetical protein C490_10160 [Natronobacterium gregoryi SP2]PLK20528.1 hypothetical protein CYV19_08765 [Natronobacterium gregoryi SP2]
MSAPERQRSWSDVRRIPSFFDRLEEVGGLPVLDVVADLTEDAGLEVPTGGVIYHDRGIQVPGHDATFVHEPTGSRGRPAFSIEVDTVGPRNAWAVFDRTVSWDVYLLWTEGLAAVAWMSDEEYRIDESEFFDAKEAALAGGRFSFGVFLYGDEEWQDRAQRLAATTSPAYLRSDDGSAMFPSTQSEFYQYVDSTPTEFRTSGNADSYLGLLELELTID